MRAFAGRNPASSIETLQKHGSRASGICRNYFESVAVHKAGFFLSIGILNSSWLFPISIYIVFLFGAIHFWVIFSILIFIRCVTLVSVQ